MWVKAIIPELSHFNVLKLLQDKANKDLKWKTSSWVTGFPQFKQIDWSRLLLFLF